MKLSNVYKGKLNFLELRNNLHYKELSYSLPWMNRLKTPVMTIIVRNTVVITSNIQSALKSQINY